ncbi:hypothetical protein V8G54_011463 [Vigna mungo]|uniref:DNA polymerase n=1 Tax=Vigna mungo TaxID=3915 RepID=A0AAQ3NSB6_VIGMU
MEGRVAAAEGQLEAVEIVIAETKVDTVYLQHETGALRQKLHSEMHYKQQILKGKLCYDKQRKGQRLSPEALTDSHGQNKDVEQNEAAINTKDSDGSESSDQDEEDTMKEGEASDSDNEDSPNSNALNGDQIQEHIEFHDGRRRRRAIFGNDIDQSDVMDSEGDEDAAASDDLASSNSESSEEEEEDDNDNDDTNENGMGNVVIICGGSYRRGKATCGDIDIIITHPDGQSHKGFLPKFVKHLKHMNFLREDLIFSIHSEEGSDSGVDTYFGFCTYPRQELRRRIDLKVYPRHIYAFGLIAWTGNDVLNRRLRLLAESKGFRLDDTGLFPATHGSGSKRGAKGIASLKFNTEKEVFHFLDFPWLEPHERNL